MKNQQSKFEKFAISKESSKKINGGTDTTVIAPVNMITITDPLRKRDKN